MARDYKIVKKTSGAVQIVDNNDEVQIQLLESSSIKRNTRDESVMVTDTTGVPHSLKSVRILETQLEPAAAIPFAGTTAESLYTVLIDFFF